MKINYVHQGMNASEAPVFQPLDVGLIMIVRKDFVMEVNAEKDMNANHIPNAYLTSFVNLENVCPKINVM